MPARRIPASWVFRPQLFRVTRISLVPSLATPRCRGVSQGWEGSCPYKQALSRPLDVGSGKTCPLCSAESLAAALGSRAGQDVTSGLLLIKAASENAFSEALQRLDRFDTHGRNLPQEFRSRIARAEHRRSRSALRRPAAAGPELEPRAAGEHAGGDGAITGRVCADAAAAAAGFEAAAGAAADAPELEGEVEDAP